MIHPRPADYAALVAVSPLCLALGAWLVGYARAIMSTGARCRMCREWHFRRLIDGHRWGFSSGDRRYHFASEAPCSDYRPRWPWYPHWPQGSNT